MKKNRKTIFLSNRLFYIYNINQKTKNMSNEIDELEKSLDQLKDEQSRKLYDHIVEMGISAFERDSALYKHKDSGLLERLISHFQEIEEYEKCAKLLKVSRLLNCVR
jgi:DNA-binding transcriptional regulator GbsR (MarR family)